MASETSHGGPITGEISLAAIFPVTGKRPRDFSPIRLNLPTGEPGSGVFGRLPSTPRRPGHGDRTRLLDREEITVSKWAGQGLGTFHNAMRGW